MRFIAQRQPVELMTILLAVFLHPANVKAFAEWLDREGDFGEFIEFSKEKGLNVSDGVANQLPPRMDGSFNDV